VPYSLTVHAVDLYKPMPALPRVLTTAIAVVAMTEYNAALLRSKYGVSPRLIRFGINLSPGNVRRDHAPPVVLTVGRNVPKKGLDVVCRVAQNFDRPARFVLYSNLSPVESVEVHGLVAHADVLAAMASAHVFLLPCRVAPDGDMDGLPVVIVEAMAAGLPVITTPVSGIPELVDEQVGWLVPPDNVDATAQALREALDHPAEAARRGLAGQRRVREMGFDRDSLVREMRAVLDA
jgi:glycosyltransferase involved in cell wall biosynthesis